MELSSYIQRHISHSSTITVCDFKIHIAGAVFGSMEDGRQLWGKSPASRFDPLEEIVLPI